MEAERRKYVLLAALALALVATMYRAWPSGTSVARVQPSNQQGQRTAAGRTAPAAAAPDVHLDALDGDRPKPGPSERNLFRFKPKAPPPPPPSAARGAGPASASVPAGPPPPIAFKFIGVVEAPDQTAKIAVLSDGRNVFHGREGDIIEGRYRIVRIGAESIEMAYLDGRGRQTIRLTGS